MLKSSKHMYVKITDDIEYPNKVYRVVNENKHKYTLKGDGRSIKIDKGKCNIVSKKDVLIYFLSCKNTLLSLAGVLGGLILLVMINTGVLDGILGGETLLYRLIGILIIFILGIFSPTIRFIFWW